MKRRLAVMLAIVLLPVLAHAYLAQAGGPASQPAAVEDEYVRYELLPPSTGSFRVAHDLSIVTAGATSYTDVIPRRSRASDISVIDLMSGAPLVFKAADSRIDITLARPVPAGGQARIRILETLHDDVSYHPIGEDVVFEHPSSIRRVAVALPKNFELVRADVPVQVIQDADGRIAVNFMSLYPFAGALGGTVRIQARPLKNPGVSVQENMGIVTGQPPQAPPDTPPSAPAITAIRVSERAVQDREIVYFLKQPETHAFSLYHDYTASREGEHQYVNVVRAGSTVSDPSAIVLDTGETLTHRTLTGADVAREKLDIGERVEPDTVVVVIPFTPVRKGGSVRLRISETYTDPARYTVVAGELLWHRSFGRNRNDMVLPAGWYLTTSSIPAVITQEPDGRVRLSYWNPRPDSVDVFVKARRR